MLHIKFQGCKPSGSEEREFHIWYVALAFIKKNENVFLTL